MGCDEEPPIDEQRPGRSGLPTTYTDSNGTTTTVPAPGASGSVYQSNVGSQVIGAWGGMASQQAADPSLTAGAASSVMPPPGTTFGRFDGIGSLSFTTGNTQDAIDTQVQQRDQVDQSSEQAIESGFPAS